MQNEKLEEFNNYIRFRKVAVIGLGVSNLPMIDYLHEQKARVTVFDQRTIDQIPKDIMDKIIEYSFEFSLGETYLSKLQGFDLILRSPSCLPTIPELVAEADRGALVTTEIELLIKMCPAKIIGVTGSDGKTTTTSLIYAILKNSGYNAWLGGNIGTPLFTKLPEMMPDDVVVLELSSFQLMEMNVSPSISVITNITPNHLNIHKDYEEYIEAKKNIFKYQDENGILILNYDNEITRDCGKEALGKVIYFSSQEKLENGYIVDNGIIKECEDGVRKYIMECKEAKLRGVHNYQNICTALAATKTLVDTEKAIEIIKDFNAVEHRLEFVRETNGIKWYNDSASSSPTRTISGINAFEGEDVILIAGGYDKNLDYTPLAKPVVDNVKSLILMGQTANKILDAVTIEMERQNKIVKIYMCDSLQEVIDTARRIANSGDVVLFSPGSASFDMFKNAYDRGNQFKNLVHNL